MEALFVGGVWDGERHQVMDGSERVRAVRPIETILSVAEFAEYESMAPAHVQYDEYRIFELRGQNRRHALYALIDLDADRIIQLLLRHYKPKEG